MDEYKTQVIDDLKTWAEEGDAAGLTMDELKDRLQDPTWTDSITGNGSGSYYCNAYKAREMIDKTHLLWDGDFLSALESYGQNIGELIERGPEVVDVWARCIALEYLDDEELTEATGVK